MLYDVYYESNARVHHRKIVPLSIPKMVVEQNERWLWPKKICF